MAEEIEYKDWEVWIEVRSPNDKWRLGSCRGYTTKEKALKILRQIESFVDKNIDGVK